MTGGDDAPDACGCGDRTAARSSAAELEKVARSRRTPQAVAQRARIVLMTADGVCARRHRLSNSASRSRRFASGAPAMSKKAWLDCATSRARAARELWTISAWPILLNQALQTRPAKQTHWSVRSFAAEANISKDMAHRLFRAAEHRAAPLAQLQAVQRPGLRREGARHHGAVPEPARSRAGAVRGREEPDPGAGAHAAAAADGASATSRVSPTTTFAMAPPRCSPHSMWPTAR